MSTITEQILEELTGLSNPSRDDLQRLADKFGKSLPYIQAVLCQNRKFPQAQLLHNPKVQAILRLFHTEDVLRTAAIREQLLPGEVTSEIAEDTLFSADSEINLYLRRLVEAGILIRIKRGHYRVSEIYKNEVFRSWDKYIIGKYPTPYIGNDDMLITIYGMDDAVFSQKRDDDYTKSVLRMIQLKNSIQNLVEKMVEQNLTVVESQMHDAYLAAMKNVDRASVRRFLQKNMDFILFNLARLTYHEQDTELIRTRLRDLFQGWMIVYPHPDELVVPKSEFISLSLNGQREVLDFLIRRLEERPINDPSMITVVCHSQNTIGRELMHLMPATDHGAEAEAEAQVELKKA